MEEFSTAVICGKTNSNLFDEMETLRSGSISYRDLPFGTV